MAKDLMLNNSEWTEITGLEEGSSYNIQCINPSLIKLMEFSFTQSANAPDKDYKCTIGCLGVAFKKGETKVWVKCQPNVNVHVEDIL